MSFFFPVYFYEQIYTLTTVKMLLDARVVSPHCDRSKLCHILNRIKPHILNGYKGANAIYKIYSDTKEIWYEIQCPS